MTPLLSKQCARCGETDLARRLGGLVELLVYIAGGLSAAGLVIWVAIAYLA